MKTLKEAVNCLIWFSSSINLAIENLDGVRKLYKKAALLVHSDRQGSETCPFTMVDVNAAWELISKYSEAKVMEIVSDCIGSESRKAAFESAANAWKNDPLHEASVPAFFTVNTLSRDAWNLVDSSEEFRWFSAFNTTYFQDLHWEYKHWSGSESMCFVDLTNAYLVGKKCVSFRLHFNINKRDADSCSAWYKLLREQCQSTHPKAVVEWLESLEMSDMGRGLGVCASFIVGDVEVRIYRDELQANQVFSPFVLERLKPVVEAPTRWTNVHLRRIVANGQFTQLKQNYYYTDDYAYDAATNFRKGYIKNPIKSLAEMLGDKLHIYSSVDKSGKIRLSFGAHSNDGRSLIVDLNNRYPSVDMETEEIEFLQGPIKLLGAA